MDLYSPEFGSAEAESEQAVQSDAIPRVKRRAEQLRPSICWERAGDLALRPRTADARSRADRYVAFIFAPRPERSDDACDLLPGARGLRGPQVDNDAQVLGGNLDQLAVGQRQAHAGEDGLVVSLGRRCRSVLVAQPSHVPRHHQPERGRPVALILHRFADHRGELRCGQGRDRHVAASDGRCPA